MASQVEEFLMPVSEEEGSEDMPFQQHEAPSHFHKEVTDLLNNKIPEKQTAGAGYHLATSFALPYSP
jgi:hypothetical protein